MLTGHVASSSTDTGTGNEACDTYAFTICLECSCCPIDGWDGAGWYCVLDAATGTGTEAGNGTGSNLGCIAVYLTDDDKCDDTITICSGPYASEASAEVYCPTDTPIAPPTPGVTCAAPAEIQIGVTYTTTITNAENQWFQVPAGSPLVAYKVTISAVGPAIRAKAIQSGGCFAVTHFTDQDITTETCYDVTPVADLTVWFQGNFGATTYSFNITAGTC